MYGAVLQFNAVGDALHVLLGDILVSPHVIDFLLHIFGMCELRGEVAVVGEEQHACGVAVETAYGVYAFVASPLHEVEHGCAPIGVVGSGHAVLRLVEKDIALAFECHNLFIIFHRIVVGYLGSEFGNHLPVDFHQPLLDKFVGLTARAQTGIGHELVQTDLFIGIGKRQFIFNALGARSEALALAHGAFLEAVALHPSGAAVLIVTALLVIATLLTIIVAGLITALLIVARLVASLLVVTVVASLLAIVVTGLVTALLIVARLVASLLVVTVVATLLVVTVVATLLAIVIAGLVTALLVITGLVATLLTVLVVALLTIIVARLVTTLHRLLGLLCFGTFYALCGSCALNGRCILLHGAVVGTLITALTVITTLPIVIALIATLLVIAVIPALTRLITTLAVITTLPVVVTRLVRAVLLKPLVPFTTRHLRAFGIIAE